jgi:hypothetical protein
LPESWLDTEGINPAKKQVLKFLSEQLELKPLGFVVTDTALIAYLKIEEGSPPNAIFLQIGSSDINVTLVKMGKTIGSQLVGKSGDLGADVEEGLSRFDNVDTLPARMILYDGQTDFEEDKQQLISYAWEEKLPFIHFPKVEALTGEVTVKAVALAGGSEVAKSLGFEIKAPKNKTERAEQTSEVKEATAASLGFMTGKDVAETIKPEPKAEAPVEATEILEAAGVAETTAADAWINLITFLRAKLNILKTLFRGLQSGNKLIWMVGGFFILLLGLLLAYWFVPKATVTLVVQPQSLEEVLTITIDPNTSSLDGQNNILPGNQAEIKVSGSKTLPTTGATIVGDPARGEVTIYNKTGSSKTFDSGTRLTGPNNVIFTLDDDTTIASSAATTEGITFGKATVTVAAESIGPDGNLASGSELVFQEFADSDYSAQVNQGLSGGTAREVKAVAEEDIEQLKTALLQDLKTKATEQLKNTLGEGVALVDIAGEEDLSAQSFNHEVGEEADSLKLNYKGLSYLKQDLQLLLEQATKEKIPQNFQLSASSETSVQSATMATDGSATVKIGFKAQLIPRLDFAMIKDNLKGRYPKLVEEYLAKLPSFVKAEIKITPNLPKALKTLPRISKNIFIEVKTEP